ncbi:MAG TPA: HEAT repeat domain-containing protein [Planctomycetota bacterium]|nr:HEAT repeat domain-containing protein [Planctomycetota bacterium]
MSQLRRDMESPDWQVRCAAVGSLAGARLDDKTLPLLFKGLEDPVLHVRDRAAYALAHHLRTKPEPIIFEQAMQASTAVKLSVARAIEHHHYPQAANDLLISMLSDPSPDIQRAAALALPMSEHPQKRSLLLELWRNSPDEKMRTAALVAATYPVEDTCADENLLHYWRDLVQHQPEMLRTPHVLEAAGNLRLREAAPCILPLVRDPELCYLAVEALGSMRYREAVPVLLELLEKDESWVMNREVCEALGKIRAEESVPALARLFQQSHPQTDRDSWDRTLFIVIAMSEIGGDDVFESFVAHLTNKEKRDFALGGLVGMAGKNIGGLKMRFYSWERIQKEWRRWWAENKEQVAERLRTDAGD